MFVFFRWSNSCLNFLGVVDVCFLSGGRIVVCFLGFLQVVE